MTTPPRKKKRWRWWLLPLGLFALVCLLNPRYSMGEVGQGDGTVIRAERFAIGPFGWVASSHINMTGEKVLIDVRTE